MSDKLASAILAGMKAREQSLSIAHGFAKAYNQDDLTRSIVAMLDGFRAEREAFEQAMGEET